MPKKPLTKQDIEAQEAQRRYLKIVKDLREWHKKREERNEERLKRDKTK